MKQSPDFYHKEAIRAELPEYGARWWTADLLDYMNKIAPQDQLRAARAAVRAGSVMELEVSPGLIGAMVLGSQNSKNHVRLRSSVPSEASLEAIKSRIAERALYSAQLLAGYLPVRFKNIFHDSGAALNPWESGQGSFVCSCSHSPEPCAHILTALCTAAALFDRDPFLLLKLIGIEREELLSVILAARGDYGATAENSSVNQGDKPVSWLAQESFYGGDELCKAITDFAAQSAQSPEEGSILGEPLFDFPSWRGETSFKESLKPYYKSVRKI